MKNNSREKEKDVLLVCTVGGTPRPVAVSILQHKPRRVVFIASKESRSQITLEGPKEKPDGSRKIDGRGILQICRDEKFDLDPGRYTIFEVDPQELQSCVETARKEVKREIDQWAGDQPAVIFDFTGGTKLMTAALAMVGRQLPVEFSYVASKEKSDGRDARDKDGLGITLDGEENVLRLRNPWDALGFQSIETAILFFNQSNFAAAKQLVEDHRNKATEGSPLKQQLSTFANLFSGYLNWDQFNHKKAIDNLENTLKNIANIKIWLRSGSSRTIELKLKKSIEFLTCIEEEPNKHTLVDLLSNAQRRANEGRYDDAVARLYRAIEAGAQLRLKKYSINSSCVHNNEIPKKLRKEWLCRLEEKETIKLALQDDFMLLNALKDNLGKRFIEKGLDKKESQLGLRNSSILAHGFTPIGEKSYKQLWDITVDILEMKNEELLKFPSLEI